jgi:hypothetical protein
VHAATTSTCRDHVREQRIRSLTFTWSTVAPLTTAPNTHDPSKQRKSEPAELFRMSMSHEAALDPATLPKPFASMNWNVPPPSLPEGTRARQNMTRGMASSKSGGIASVPSCYKKYAPASLSRAVTLAADTLELDTEPTPGTVNPVPMNW